MAATLSITSEIPTLTVFALRSSQVLYQTVASGPKQRSVLQLKDELEALGRTLKILQDTVPNTNVDLSVLRLPLLRCGKACEDFQALLVDYTTGRSNTSFQEWAKLEYMGGGIIEFKEILAGYNSTIIIVISTFNMSVWRRLSGSYSIRINLSYRHIAALSISGIKDYEDLITNTTVNLEEHLREINDRLRAFAPKGSTLSVENVAKQKGEKQHSPRCR